MWKLWFFKNGDQKRGKFRKKSSWTYSSRDKNVIKWKNIAHERVYHVTKENFENFKNCGNYEFFRQIFWKFIATLAAVQFFLKLAYIIYNYISFNPWKKILEHSIGSRVIRHVSLGRLCGCLKINGWSDQKTNHTLWSKTSDFRWVILIFSSELWSIWRQEFFENLASPKNVHVKKCQILHNSELKIGIPHLKSDVLLHNV